jgi:hypothetical protein
MLLDNRWLAICKLIVYSLLLSYDHAKDDFNEELLSVGGKFFVMGKF